LRGQAKILRVLEQRELKPLGARRARPVNIRLVAATNCDLAELVIERKFRQDLFFRINVIHIHIPPLRERREDIPLLANHFLTTLASQYNRPWPVLTALAAKGLMQQPWVGNIRELRNVIERMFLLCDPKEITEHHLAAALDASSSWRAAPGRPPEIKMHFSPQIGSVYRASHTNVRIRKTCSSESSELHQLRWALAETKWNKTKAAELLEWSRMTIYRKIVQYDLRPSVQVPDSQP
jgi:DNA-binding NtrC family response regulator